MLRPPTSESPAAKIVIAAVGLFVLLGLVALIWRPAKGKITIDTRPSGGKVLLAGQYCPAGPCEFELPPGEYSVQATKLNYQGVETTVDVTAGATVVKTIRLLPMEPTAEEAGRMGLVKKPDEAGGHYDKVVPKP